MPKRFFALSCLLLSLLVQAPAHAEMDYQLGQGMSYGDFIFSGYANVVLLAPHDGTTELSIDDLSLYVNGRINRWLNPFFEAELSSITLWQEGDATSSSGKFVPERFYNDTHLNDTDTLRLGKILSPVGDWNSIHAAPLVPTVTRPLTTYRGFSEYTNGISWLHETPWGDGAQWQFYWPGKEWLPRPDTVAPRHFRDVLGAHVNWQLGLVDMVGLSFQHGEMSTTSEDYSLFGINGRKTLGPLVLEGEAITSQWSGSAPRAHDTEWGAYALADYAVTPQWHGIVEAEHYQDHQISDASKNILVGLAYKPEPAIVWKLEYVNQSGVSTDIVSGWFASLAVLF